VITAYYQHHLPVTAVLYVSWCFISCELIPLLILFLGAGYRVSLDALDSLCIFSHLIPTLVNLTTLRSTGKCLYNLQFISNTTEEKHQSSVKDIFRRSACSLTFLRVVHIPDSVHFLPQTDLGMLELLLLLLLPYVFIAVTSTFLLHLCCHYITSTITVIFSSPVFSFLVITSLLQLLLQGKIPSNTKTQIPKPLKPVDG
jgi:hypothetical protein